jgi:hypothetical protein
VSRGRAYFRSRNTALLLGYASLAIGIWTIRDAYERRNVDRPWWSSVLPG